MPPLQRLPAVFRRLSERVVRSMPLRLCPAADKPPCCPPGGRGEYDGGQGTLAPGCLGNGSGTGSAPDAGMACRAKSATAIRTRAEAAAALSCSRYASSNSRVSGSNEPSARSIRSRSIASRFMTRPQPPNHAAAGVLLRADASVRCSAGAAEPPQFPRNSARSEGALRALRAAAAAGG